MKESITVGSTFDASAVMGAGLVEKLEAPRFRYDFQCIGPDDADREEYLALMFESEQMRLQGNILRADMLAEEAKLLTKVKWEESIYNLVTNVGRNDVLDKYFKGSAYTASWFLGLKGTGTAAAADTASSHAGWSEVTPYSGNRPAISFGTTASQSNTATQISYTINATATVAGAFIQSVNTGTTGILYSAGDFAASRSVASGDTLNVTPTVTA